MAVIAPELYDRLVVLRRTLHQYPELSGQETRTASAIGKFLHDFGIPHRMNIAGHGVVADIPGDSGVPCVVLRADMDALPIQEETGLEFLSVHRGVMHACGHDGHTTMLLGAAALLSQEPDLPAPVRLIFQPAEEKGTGAIAMIKEGALDGAGLIFGGPSGSALPPWDYCGERGAGQCIVG
ncbi:M20 metallopeptidase family protein [Nitrospira sp. CMX1]|nr:amidohydrolase [Nitrospira sp.]